MKGRSLIWSCLIATCLCGSLKNNRYDGLMAYVHKDVDLKPRERDDFVSSLKTLLEETSQSLYDSTLRRVYLGDVNIILPSDWSVEDGNGTMSVGRNTKFDVTVTNKGYGGKVPYTPQGGMCQGPGLMVNIPLEFIMDSDLQAEFGDPGKLLANEFLKLKYGVYDEFGQPGSEDTPHTFFDPLKNDMRVSSCTDNDSLEGKWKNKKDKTCEPDMNDEDCRFEITDSQSDYSTMFITHMDSIKQVCDDSKHDFVSPTPQNQICFRSILDVILDHPDFLDETNDPGDEGQDTTPYFEIYTMDLHPVMIVIDVDFPEGYEEEVQTILDQIPASINETVREGLVNMLGVAYFSVKSEEDSDKGKLTYFDNGHSIRSDILFPLDEIDEEKLKDFVLGLSPVTSDHSPTASILEQVILDIENNYKIGTEFNIILIQTAEDTSEEFDMDETTNVYVISSIVYGHNENQDINNVWIKDVCTSTGGLYYNDPDYNPDLIAIVIQPLTTNYLSVKIFQDDVSLGANEEYNTVIYTGNINGSDVVFSLDIYGDGTVEGELHCNNSVLEVEKNDKENYHNNAIETDWVSDVCWLNLTSKKKVDIEFSVTAVVNEDTTSEDLVDISVWSSSSQEPHNLTMSPLAFYVSLRSGASPVVGLRVNLELSAEGNVITRELTDDGSMVPDMKENDGIYSGYLNDIEEFDIDDDQFEIYADVVVMPNLVEPLEGYSYEKYLPSNPFYDLEMPDEKFLLLNRRMNKAFSQTVCGAKIYSDPPSRVTDLEVLGLDYDSEKDKEFLISVMWTAPGADFTNGTVELYELRYTYDRDRFPYFDSWTEIDDSSVVEGSLEPESFGVAQNVTVSLRRPEGEGEIVGAIAVRGVDQQGFKGQVSQPSIFIAIGYISGDPSHGNDFVGSAGFIILIIFICLIVLGGFGGGMYFHFKKSGRMDRFTFTKRKKSSENHNSTMQ